MENDPPQESLALGKHFHLSVYIAFWAILSIICWKKGMEDINQNMLVWIIKVGVSKKRKV